MSTDQNPLVPKWYRRGDSKVQWREAACGNGSVLPCWYLLDRMRMSDNIVTDNDSQIKLDGLLPLRKTRTYLSENLPGLIEITK